MVKMIDKEVLQELGIENFIRMKNGSCQNSKTYFKYWIPQKTYDLFEVAWIHNHIYDIEFYTFNENYMSIWDEFNEHQGKYGRCILNNAGYDKNYHCYVVDIKSPELLEHYLKSCYDPFHYMGDTAYLNHAHSMGYNDDEEIHKDWINYHNCVGKQFASLGLLPKDMFKGL